LAAAADGEQGLGRIRELAPALVVVDAQMPEKDGYELCRDVRGDARLDRQPHIIMLTGGERASDRERAEEAGADEFLTKPFNPAHLVARVREALGESR